MCRVERHSHNVHVLCSLIAAFFISALSASASGQVDVSLRDGRVTLTARNATIKEILDAWSLSGRTIVVNADRIGGPPLSLQFVDVPEEQALDALLRTVSGYLAVPRSERRGDQSRFGRIVILPSSIGTRAPVEMMPPPPPLAAPPQAMPTNVNGVSRLLGPDGRLVEDDQAGAPPPTPRPSTSRR